MSISVHYAVQARIRIIIDGEQHDILTNEKLYINIWVYFFYGFVLAVKKKLL